MELKRLPDNILVESVNYPDENVKRHWVKHLLEQLQQETGIVPPTYDQGWMFAKDKADDNKIIGALCGAWHDGAFVINVLYVESKYRRQGIGSALLHDLMCRSIEYVIIEIEQEDPPFGAFLKARKFEFVRRGRRDGWWCLNGPEYRGAIALTANRKDIGKMGQYIHWGPDGKDVTLDGTFDMAELAQLVWFMKNGGPGEGNCKHEDLKDDY